jgi:hypothetical protein
MLALDPYYEMFPSSYRRPWPGFGFSADSLNYKADMLQARIGAMSGTAWQDLTKLAPVNFVVDLLTMLQRDVVDPFRRLRDGLASSWLTFYKNDEYQRLGRQGEETWKNYLAPVLFDALELQRLGVKLMPLPYTASPIRPGATTVLGTLQKRVIRFLYDYEEAYRQIAAVWDRTPSVLKSLQSWGTALDTARNVVDKVDTLADNAAATLRAANLTLTQSQQALQTALATLQAKSNAVAAAVAAAAKEAEATAKEAAATARRIKLAVTLGLLVGGGFLTYFLVRRSRVHAVGVGARRSHTAARR